MALQTLPDGPGVFTAGNHDAIAANFTTLNALSGTPTGTGSPVLANSPTLVTPALGTPSALVLTSATGLPGSTGLVANSVASGQLDPTTIQIVSIPLSSAQIKAINGGITILAAQGAGTFIEFVSGVIDYSFLTGAYVNGGGGPPTYVIQVGGVTVWADAVGTKMATALKAGANAVATLGPAVGIEGASSVLLNGAMTLQNTAGPTFDLVTGAGSAILKVAYRVYSGLS